MKKRILFVDDEVHVLQGLRRMLYPMRQEWDMAFAESGSAALEQLRQQRFDVIVTDMRMPEMDGAQLLTQVQQHYPHMVRIVLSGYSDRQLVLKSVGPAHQYLSKPCAAEKLKNTIARTGALRDLIDNDLLRQRVAGMQILPSLPTLYLELVEISQNPNASIEKITALIARDIGMTAKILQLANSAFFGIARHVSSTAQAVNLLGLDIVKALVLSGQVFTQFDSCQIRQCTLDTLWQHSLAVGACAKRIAQLEGCARTMIDDVFMAGMLHDAGKLILAANYPKEYQHAQALGRHNGLTDWQAESAVLGASHAEVGGYLLDLWGLPSEIVEAVAFHHCPDASPHQTFIGLTAIHVATAIVCDTATAEADTPAEAIDMNYLTRLGLKYRLALWRQQCVLPETGRDETCPPLKPWAVVSEVKEEEYATYCAAC